MSVDAEAHPSNETESQWPFANRPARTPMFLAVGVTVAVALALSAAFAKLNFAGVAVLVTAFYAATTALRQAELSAATSEHAKDVLQAKRDAALFVLVGHCILLFGTGLALFAAESFAG